MTFADFAGKYFDFTKADRLTKADDILKDSGLDVRTFTEFLDFAEKVLLDSLNKSGGTVPAVQVYLDAWNAAHPATAGFVLHTPYGDIVQADKPISQCTAKELAQVIATAVVQALK